MPSPTRESVLGLFREPAEVLQAIDDLRDGGFERAELEVLSGVPYPAGAFGEPPVRHRLFVFPFVGAACGFAVGLLVTIGTQLSYPLVTGGQPLLAVPPMINVLYEGTLLGAIVFTVLGIVFESRLPDLSGAPYDQRISQGYLGLLVVRPAGRGGLAARILRRAGAADVVTNG
jgi:hypothetical protein